MKFRKLLNRNMINKLIYKIFNLRNKMKLIINIPQMEIKLKTLNITFFLPKPNNSETDIATVSL